jgi:crotonobetainyl-CoA:carnitine CoA-transferase CaiB-like acyl-CoA transferase
MNFDTHRAGTPQWDDFFGRRPTGPLAGLVVADLSRVLAGPYCTMLLADMGATVVKVEGPDGDETRNWKPPVHGDDSTYYLSLNRNKHSIKLDFRDPDDRAVVQELIHRADVLVENFKPGDLDRFGLDYESVSAGNPGLIYASVTGFGRRGGADLPGYDLLVQGMSGLMSITGSPDTEGYRSGIAVFDVMTGLHICVGIVAALHDRERTGLGQRVEANLMSSALSAMVNQTGAYAVAGVVPTRIGNEHPSIYPYEPFPTADGELIVAVGNDGQFRRFCDEIGRPELVVDPRFAEASARSVNRAELRPLLQEALRASTSTDWFARLRGCRVPVAPIQDVAGGVQSARELGLEPVVTIGSGPDAMPTVRHPLEFSRTPASHDVPPPALDSGSDAIRAWLSVPVGESAPLGAS